MELRETIESINYKLDREFGRAFNNSPNFRVVFSEDQIEYRRTQFTKDGLELIYPEVKELPKYRQWIRQKYVLERLIPIVGETDLMVDINYEPCWVFQDKNGKYLPPWFEACKLIIESIYEAAGRKDSHAKYKDPQEDPAKRLEKLEGMERELFGNETEVGDHLTYGTGIVVPGFEVDKSESGTESVKIETKKETVN